MPEVSCDAHGNYCGDDVPHDSVVPEISVMHPHWCPDAGPIPEECGRFICDACKRVVPWCLGGGDDSLCDNCWAEKDGACNA